MSRWIRWKGASVALLGGLLFAAAPPARGQELSPTEAEIVQYVDTHTDEAIDLLERITNINSGTMNPEGVREVGRVFHAELDSLGFQTRWIDLPDSLGRAGHLFAERSGGEGKHLLLIGHLDTVFEEDSPFQTFVREGDVARGPGVADMKGGDVVMLYALKALESAGALEGTNITVALTGDEESPGDPLEISRRDLIEAGKRAGIALGFEGGVRDSTGEYGTIARRSSSGWTLRVRGKTGHSSRVFSEGAGAGAIFETARILNDFYEEVRGEEYLTFNPGLILGGTDVRFDDEQSRGTAFGKSNVIAQEVVVSGGIRTISDEQLERAREKMREIVARHLPQTSAEITFSEGYPAMPPTAGNEALFAELNEINRDLGLPPMALLDPSRRGAADISFVAPYVDGLAGVGVHGSGAHSPEEEVDLASMPTAIKRAALLIYRLTR